MKFSYKNEITIIIIIIYEKRQEWIKNSNKSINF